MQIIYFRKDGTYFEASLFHPRMETAGVIDPADGHLKTLDGVAWSRAYHSEGDARHNSPDALTYVRAECEVEIDE